MSALIPKSKNIWVFGSTGGMTYSDNSKYLYDYVVNNHKGINAVWLTHSKDVYSILRKQSKKVYFINSFWGFWYSARASVGIVTHGITDINQYACGRMKIVECWHGIPMKPVLLSDPKVKAIKKRKATIKLSFLFPFLRNRVFYNDFLAICGSGELSNKILRKVFGFDAPILTLGFPRLDGLFNVNRDNRIVRKLIELEKNKGIAGIYMPTYRQKGEFDIVGYFKENIHVINHRLEAANSYLFVKTHSFENSNVDFQDMKRIFPITNKEIEDDIYSILGAFDFLITDYSSIAFDFLVLGKPVFFLTPDRDSYIQSNGEFVFDYMDLKLKAADSWEHFFNDIDIREELMHNKYSSLRDRLHKYRDGRNSERLYKYISSQI